MAIEEKVIQTNTEATEAVAAQPPVPTPSPSLGYRTKQNMKQN